MHRQACPILGSIAFLMPLLFISVSIALSPWFSFLNNALSDLGHATRSSVAILFNLGLSTGGILLILFGATCVYKVNRAIGIVLMASGYFLTLIAVFDEVYGRVHYVVSVIFFLSLAAGASLYAYTYKSLKASLALVISVLVWSFYFTKIIKCGVAVPETISILATLIWYIELLFKVSKIK